MTTTPDLSKIEFNYEYLTEQKDLDRLQHWLIGRPYFVWDTETDGLNPFQNKVILLQIGDRTKQWIIDNRLIDVSELKVFFEDDSIIKIGHNLKFDVRFMMAEHGWNIKNLMDTMLAEQVLRAGLHLKVDLGSLVHHYLRLVIDKEDELRQSFGITEPGKMSERQLEYAAGDVIYPEYIARHQKPLLTARKLRPTIQLENEVLPVIAKMEHVGLRIDIDQWNSVYQDELEEKAKAEKILDRYFGVENYSQADFFGDAIRKKTVNYESSQQVLTAFSKLGYQLENTDSKYVALQAIQGLLPVELAQALIAYRIHNKRVGTYGLNILACIEEATGHIHSNFTQCFTTTGRLSSTKPNVQNIPGNPRYRWCFIPDEGYVFVIYDLKSIEPRILGDMSLDPTYIRAFAEDEDIYSIIGENIYHEEVSKAPGKPSELRAKSKIGVLGTSYGTGKNKFYERMLLDFNRNKEKFLNSEIKIIDRSESDLVYEGIFTTCPKIKDALDKSSNYADPLNSKRMFYDDRAAYDSFGKVLNMIKKAFLLDEDGEPLFGKTMEQVDEIATKRAKKRAYITYSCSANERKRFFRPYHRSWWTDGRNHPIQSTASDIMKTAMVLIAKRIEEENHDATIVNQAHDELLVMVRKDQAVEVDKYVKELMEQAGNKFLRVVPCVAEGGIKTRWEKD